MSFITWKNRLFLDGPRQPLPHIRNEAQLKSYYSATDPRAWCDDVEQRRRHILELVSRTHGECRTKLLAAGDADELEGLRKRIAELEEITDAYKKIKLTPQQQHKFDEMVRALEEELKSEMEKRDAQREAFQKLGPGDDSDKAQSHKRYMKHGLRSTEPVVDEDIMVLYPETRPVRGRGRTKAAREAAAGERKPGDGQEYGKEGTSAMDSDELRAFLEKNLPYSHRNADGKGLSGPDGRLFDDKRGIREKGGRFRGQNSKLFNHSTGVRGKDGRLRGSDGRLLEDGMGVRGKDGKMRGPDGRLIEDDKGLRRAGGRPRDDSTDVKRADGRIRGPDGKRLDEGASIRGTDGKLRSTDGKLLDNGAGGRRPAGRLFDDGVVVGEKDDNLRGPDGSLIGAEKDIRGPDGRLRGPNDKLLDDNTGVRRADGRIKGSGGKRFDDSVGIIGADGKLRSPDGRLLENGTSVRAKDAKLREPGGRLIGDGKGVRETGGRLRGPDDKLLGNDTGVRRVDDRIRGPDGAGIRGADGKLRSPDGKLLADGAGGRGPDGRLLDDGVGVREKDGNLRGPDGRLIEGGKGARGADGRLRGPDDKLLDYDTDVRRADGRIRGPVGKRLDDDAGIRGADSRLRSPDGKLLDDGANVKRADGSIRGSDGKQLNEGAGGRGPDGRLRGPDGRLLDDGVGVREKDGNLRGPDGRVIEGGKGVRGADGRLIGPDNKLLEDDKDVRRADGRIKKPDGKRLDDGAGIRGADSKLRSPDGKLLDDGAGGRGSDGTLRGPDGRLLEDGASVRAKDAKLRGPDDRLIADGKGVRGADGRLRRPDDKLLDDDTDVRRADGRIRGPDGKLLDNGAGIRGANSMLRSPDGKEDGVSVIAKDAKLRGPDGRLIADGKGVRGADGRLRGPDDKLLDDDTGVRRADGGIRGPDDKRLDDGADIIGADGKLRSPNGKLLDGQDGRGPGGKMLSGSQDSYGLGVGIVRGRGRTKATGPENHYEKKNDIGSGIALKRPGDGELKDPVSSDVGRDEFGRDVVRGRGRTNATKPSETTLDIKRETGSLSKDIRPVGVDANKRDSIRKDADRDILGKGVVRGRGRTRSGIDARGGEDFGVGETDGKGGKEKLFSNSEKDDEASRKRKHISDIHGAKKIKPDHVDGEVEHPRRPGLPLTMGISDDDDDDDDGDYEDYMKPSVSSKRKSVADGVRQRGTPLEKVGDDQKIKNPTGKVVPDKIKDGQVTPREGKEALHSTTKQDIGSNSVEGLEKVKNGKATPRKPSQKEPPTSKLEIRQKTTDKPEHGKDTIKKPLEQETPTELERIPATLDKNKQTFTKSEAPATQVEMPELLEKSQSVKLTKDDKKSVEQKLAASKIEVPKKDISDKLEHENDMIKKSSETEAIKEDLKKVRESLEKIKSLISRDEKNRLKPARAEPTAGLAEISELEKSEPVKPKGGEIKKHSGEQAPESLEEIRELPQSLKPGTLSARKDASARLVHQQHHKHKPIKRAQSAFRDIPRLLGSVDASADDIPIKVEKSIEESHSEESLELFEQTSLDSRSSKTGYDISKPRKRKTKDVKELTYKVIDKVKDETAKLKEFQRKRKSTDDKEPHQLEVDGDKAMEPLTEKADILREGEGKSKKTKLKNFPEYDLNEELSEGKSQPLEEHTADKAESHDKFKDDELKPQKLKDLKKSDMEIHIEKVKKRKLELTDREKSDIETQTDKPTKRKLGALEKEISSPTRITDEKELLSSSRILDKERKSKQDKDLPPNEISPTRISQEERKSKQGKDLPQKELSSSTKISDQERKSKQDKDLPPNEISSPTRISHEERKSKQGKVLPQKYISSSTIISDEKRKSKQDKDLPPNEISSPTRISHEERKFKHGKDLPQKDISSSTIISDEKRKSKQGKDSPQKETSWPTRISDERKSKQDLEVQTEKTDKKKRRPSKEKVEKRDAMDQTEKFVRRKSITSDEQIQTASVTETLEEPANLDLSYVEGKKKPISKTQDEDEGFLTAEDKSDALLKKEILSDVTKADDKEAQENTKKLDRILSLEQVYAQGDEDENSDQMTIEDDLKDVVPTRLIADTHKKEEGEEGFVTAAEDKPETLLEEIPSIQDQDQIIVTGTEVLKADEKKEEVPTPTDGKRESVLAEIETSEDEELPKETIPERLDVGDENIGIKKDEVDQIFPTTSEDKLTFLEEEEQLKSETEKAEEGVPEDTAAEISDISDKSFEDQIRAIKDDLDANVTRILERELPKALDKEKAEIEADLKIMVEEEVQNALERLMWEKLNLKLSKVNLPVSEDKLPEEKGKHRTRPRRPKKKFVAMHISREPLFDFELAKRSQKPAKKEMSKGSLTNTRSKDGNDSDDEDKPSKSKKSEHKFVEAESEHKLVETESKTVTLRSVSSKLIKSENRLSTLKENTDESKTTTTTTTSTEENEDSKADEGPPSTSEKDKKDKDDEDNSPSGKTEPQSKSVTFLDDLQNTQSGTNEPDDADEQPKSSDQQNMESDENTRRLFVSLPELKTASNESKLIDKTPRDYKLTSKIPVLVKHLPLRKPVLTYMENPKLNNLISKLKDVTRESNKLNDAEQSLSKANEQRKSNREKKLTQEVEIKSRVIHALEETLASSQLSFKRYMQDVSADAKCLKARVQELENRLIKAEGNVVEKVILSTELQSQVAENTQNNKKLVEYVEIVEEELQTSKAENKKLREMAKKMITLTADEQVQMMLRQPESSIRRIVDELGRQYREWAYMCYKHRHRNPSKKLTM